VVASLTTVDADDVDVGAEDLTLMCVNRDQLGIDQLLDPEDVVDTVKPDEKSMIAYLSLFFQKFASLARKQVSERGRIPSLVDERQQESLRVHEVHSGPSTRTASPRVDLVCSWVSCSALPVKQALIDSIVQGGVEGFAYECLVESSPCQALIDSIVKAVALTRKHDGLIYRYKSSARNLKAWLAEHTAKLQAPDDSRLTQDIKDKIDALQEVGEQERF
jgi:hypothetical protein